MIQNFTIVRTVSELRQVIGEWRRVGLSVGLVPTMGALHEGHFSLVDRSVMENDRTCVSLFVNPKQFSPTEDFDLYPRNEAADAQALQCRGANVLFAPLVEEMYPADAATSVSVSRTWGCSGGRVWGWFLYWRGHGSFQITHSVYGRPGLFWRQRLSTAPGDQATDG